MQKIFALLAPLALAAAASAQTAGLPPTAQGGFAYSVKADGWLPAKTFRTWLSGLGPRAAREGWAAEFDLSAFPTGARIASAVLVAAPSGSFGNLSLGLRGYRGDGAVGGSDMSLAPLLATLTPPTWAGGAFDVTASLQARVAAGDRYAGFSLAPASGSGGATWTSPNLQVSYTVDHGLAKGGWPSLGGSPSIAWAGGPVRSSGVFTDAPIQGTLQTIGPDGSMYGTRADGVFALDASGAERWRQGVSTGLTGLALSADGTLYGVGRDLTAMDAATGAVRWSVNLNTNSDDGIQVQILEDGTVLAVNEQGIAGFDHDGNKLWSRATAPETGAVAADGTFVMSNYWGGVYCFDPHTGAMVAQYGQGPACAHPIPVGGMVTWAEYVPTGGSHSLKLQPDKKSYLAVTTQSYALNLYTAPLHGGTPTVVTLKTGTSVASARWNGKLPPNYPQVPPPPDDMEVRQFGRAPNGLFVMALFHEVDLIGPAGISRLAVTGGPFAISSDNVMYLDTRDSSWNQLTAAYDLANAKWLWSVAAPYTTYVGMNPIIGVDGAIWHRTASNSDYGAFRRVR